MNVLSDEKRAIILRALCEGNSIRATARLCGVAKRTVSNLLRDVGSHAKNYHDRYVRGVEADQVQADEIWAFVGCKERRVPKEEKGEGRGDVWTLTAIERDTKLLISYRVGNRDAENALAFMDDLAGRVATRIQLTTDAHPMYPMAVELAFGYHMIDYATVQKEYRTSPEGARRYSPPVCTGCRKERVMGNPDPDMVSTSHVERKNLTIRMSMRRFTRLTNAFSKKLDFHLYAVALHTLYYNFVKAHGTLTREARGIKTTPQWRQGSRIVRGRSTTCCLYWTRSQCYKRRDPLPTQRSLCEEGHASSHRFNAEVPQDDWHRFVAADYDPVRSVWNRFMRSSPPAPSRSSTPRESPRA